MPKLTIALLAFAATAGAQQPSASDDEIAKWFTAAQRAKAAGNLALAESEYRRVIRARPDLAEARSNLGIVYYMQGRCADALPQFQRATATRRDMDIPVLFTGICLQKMNRYAEAIPFLNRSLSMPPLRTEIYLYLALCYSGLRNERTAADWFEKFAASNPKESEAFYQLGGGYLRLSAEHLDNARRDAFYDALSRAEFGEMQDRSAAILRTRYEQTVKLRPSYPNLRWRLARVLFHEGDAAGARPWLEDELRVEPGHVPALLVLRAVCRRMSDHAAEADAARRLNEAVDHFPRSDADMARRFAAGDNYPFSLLNAVVEMEGLPAEVAKDAPTLPRVADVTGTLEQVWRSIRSTPVADWELDAYVRSRIARGELSRIRAELEGLLRRDGPSPGAEYLLAGVYHRLSLGAYARMLDIDPEGYRTMLLQAETMDLTGRDDDAEQAYRKVVSMKPEAAGVHYRLGLLLLRRRQIDLAIPELQRETEIDPYNMRAIVALGECYIEHHELDRAVHILTGVIESHPQDGPALLALARAYSQQHKPASAAPMLERALRVQPEDGNAHYQLAQIYQELGRDAEAEREFGIVRKLRSKQRSQPVTQAQP